MKPCTTHHHACQCREEAFSEATKNRDRLQAKVTKLLESKGAIGTEAEVCADIAARQQLGIKKYGTTVADNPLDLLEWLQHAYEETLDTAVYLKRAMQELGDDNQAIN